MDQKYLDHAYHRSRIDAHIGGLILLVTIVAILALSLSEKFQPFEPSVDWWEPVRQVWMERQQSWLPEQKLIEVNDFPPTSNINPNMTIRTVYPRSTSLVLAIGVLAVFYFSCRCAKRQTMLMNSVFIDHGNGAYQRPWSEIRVTFWALGATLVFLLLFMMR